MKESDIMGVVEGSARAQEEGRLMPPRYPIQLNRSSQPWLPKT